MICTYEPLLMGACTMSKPSNGKNLFNEMTRVQMPALVHLTRLGYSYYGRLFEDMADKVYDPDTNILKDVFVAQFKKLNPNHEGEAEQTLKAIRQELDNDDLGKSFYSRLTTTSPVRLIDFENPHNNVFHCTAEFTCKNGQDETAMFGEYAAASIDGDVFEFRYSLNGHTYDVYRFNINEDTYTFTDVFETQMTAIKLNDKDVTSRLYVLK